MPETPADLRYSAEHEWIRETGGEGVVRVGVTDFAQGQLGDVVYVDLPAVDQAVTAGQVCGEIESTKSVSELFAPVTGTIVARNEALESGPEQVNLDPYGAGWLVEIAVADGPALELLLTAEAYAAMTESA